MKYDVVIIGGGLGGLMCASLLARRGRSVLVLEQGAQAGGAMQTYRRGALNFDTGFHCVGGLAEGQSLHEPFRLLGLLGLPWHRLDPEGPDRVLIGSREFRLAEGFDAFASTLAQDFPHERQALRQYATLLSHIPPDTAGLAYPYLTATFRDPLLINVLAGAAMRLELRRESLPLFTFAHCQAPFIESGWRLKGDAGQLVDTLLYNIRGNGGEVRCRHQVDELAVRDGRVEAAYCTNGERLEGRTFISSLHPAATCLLLRPQLRGVYPRRMAALENTHGMLTVSLRLKPRTVRYFNWNQYVYRKPNVWTFHEDLGGVGGVLLSCRVPEAGPWASQLDLLTPLTWAKCRSWEHTRPGHRGEAYTEAKNRLADECIALAAQALPELPDAIAARYVSTPLTWRDYTLTPQGSAFGARKDGRHPLLCHLSVRTPLANLLLTGQSLVLHGVQGVAMTALQTCQTIINHPL